MQGLADAPLVRVGAGPCALGCMMARCGAWSESFSNTAPWRSPAPAGPSACLGAGVDALGSAEGPTWLPGLLSLQGPAPRAHGLPRAPGCFRRDMKTEPLRPGDQVWDCVVGSVAHSWRLGLAAPRILGALHALQAVQCAEALALAGAFPSRATC